MTKYLRTIFILAVCLCSAGVWAQTGAWSGKLEVQGVSLTIVFNLADEGSTMDSPDQGAKGIPVEVKHTDTGGISIDIPSIGASYEGIWLVRKIVGTLTQHGMSFPLTLEPGVPQLNRPQTPQGPFPYTTEEVSFRNGDAVLGGTLTLPEGYGRNTPVLIMVTGSGLQNRDEEIFEHKPFAVIADALARGGIATLRYDDRGFGESSGDVALCTTEDLKDDALGGIGLLREKFDRVGVLGNSEGGTIALMLAADRQADFIVSLAGMAVSGSELLLKQNRDFLLRAGLPAETVDTYCRLLAEAYEARIQGNPLPSADGYDLPDGLKQNFQVAAMQLGTPYMKYFLELDMRSRLGEIACPVLALNGTKDIQVDCETNLEALRSGLPDNPDNKVLPFDGLNHLFQHCSTGEVAEYKDIEETFAPEVLEVIISWLRSLRI